MQKNCSFQAKNTPCYLFRKCLLKVRAFVIVTKHLVVSVNIHDRLGSYSNLICGYLSIISAKNNVPKDGDNQMIAQKDSEDVRETTQCIDNKENQDLETGARNVPNEDGSNGSKGDSELQRQVYKPAKQHETGKDKFKNTWRRLSSVRRGTKATKRNKSEQRVGTERRDTICAQSEVHNLAPGCDKFSVDNSQTISRTLLHGGNAEHMIGSGISPSQSPGSLGLNVSGGANFDGNFSSLGSSCGNHMRPPSTTSKESETDLVTSGYFR